MAKLVLTGLHYLSNLKEKKGEIDERQLKLHKAKVKKIAFFNLEPKTRNTDQLLKTYSELHSNETMGKRAKIKKDGICVL